MGFNLQQLQAHLTLVKAVDQLNNKKIPLFLLINPLLKQQIRLEILVVQVVDPLVQRTPNHSKIQVVLVLVVVVYFHKINLKMSLISKIKQQLLHPHHH